MMLISSRSVTAAKRSQSVMPISRRTAGLTPLPTTKRQSSCSLTLSDLFLVALHQDHVVFAAADGPGQLESRPRRRR